MQNKMVSIILPVFNAERFLPQCLDSILRQTYQNWELIAVDDGSKDGSMEILKSYEKEITEYISSQRKMKAFRLLVM